MSHAYVKLCLNCNETAIVLRVFFKLKTILKTKVFSILFPFGMLNIWLHFFRHAGVKRQKLTRKIMPFFDMGRRSIQIYAEKKYRGT